MLSDRTLNLTSLEKSTDCKLYFETNFWVVILFSCYPLIKRSLFIENFPVPFVAWNLNWKIRTFFFRSNSNKYCSFRTDSVFLFFLISFIFCIIRWSKPFFFWLQHSQFEDWMLSQSFWTCKMHSPVRWINRYRYDILNQSNAQKFTAVKRSIIFALGVSRKYYRKQLQYNDFQDLQKVWSKHIHQLKWFLLIGYCTSYTFTKSTSYHIELGLIRYPFR